MKPGKGTICFIEKNSLVILAVIICLLYWVIDIIMEGGLVARALISAFILILGGIIQFLNHAQEKHHDLEKD